MNLQLRFQRYICKDFLDRVKVVKLLRYEINYFEFMSLNTLSGTWVYHSLITWIKKRKNIHDVHLALELVHLGQNLKASLFYEMELFERINIISVFIWFFCGKREKYWVLLSINVFVRLICVYVSPVTHPYIMVQGIS